MVLRRWVSVTENFGHRRVPATLQNLKADVSSVSPSSRWIRSDVVLTLKTSAFTFFTVANFTLSIQIFV